MIAASFLQARLLQGGVPEDGNPARVLFLEVTPRDRTDAVFH
jgi:hypothetical protein